MTTKLVIITDKSVAKLFEVFQMWKASHKSRSYIDEYFALLNLRKSLKCVCQNNNLVVITESFYIFIFNAFFMVSQVALQRTFGLVYVHQITFTEYFVNPTLRKLVYCILRNSIIKFLLRTEFTHFSINSVQCIAVLNRDLIILPYFPKLAIKFLKS